jgi:hypothetical protein
MKIRNPMIPYSTSSSVNLHQWPCCRFLVADGIYGMFVSIWSLPAGGPPPGELQVTVGGARPRPASDASLQPRPPAVEPGPGPEPGLRVDAPTVTGRVWILQASCRWPQVTEFTESSPVQRDRRRDAGRRATGIPYRDSPTRSDGLRRSQ